MSHFYIVPGFIGKEENAMNKGTKIRTVVLLIAMINQAISEVGEPDFGNETVNLVYHIISYLFTLAAAVIAFWYNNDFTEAACRGTAITRQIKAEQSEDYVGEYFYTEPREGGVKDEQDDL